MEIKIPVTEMDCSDFADIFLQICERFWSTSEIEYEIIIFYFPSPLIFQEQIPDRSNVLVSTIRGKINLKEYGTKLQIASYSKVKNFALKSTANWRCKMYATWNSI